MITPDSQSKQSKRREGPPIEVRKLAWHRDPTVMQGIPAEGSYDCECGETFYGGMFGDGETHTCEACGLTVDSRGWILDAEIAPALIEDGEVTP